MSYLSKGKIKEMGFNYVGANVKLSDKASFYNCKNIIIGDNVRIDDFCVLSAGEKGIEIGDHVHISVFSSLIGDGKIKLCEFSGISSRVSIYSSSDDYSGQYMTNPTIPVEFTGVTHADIHIGRHAIVGAGTIILPGATLEDGVAVGALSVVSKRCNAYGVYSGVPLKRIKERKKGMLDKEELFKKGE